MAVKGYDLEMIPVDVACSIQRMEIMATLLANTLPEHDTRSQSWWNLIGDRIQGLMNEYTDLRDSKDPQSIGHIPYKEEV